MTISLTKSLYFFAAAIAEIAGCYAFWAFFKLNKHILWVIPGIFSLCIFAYFLTFIESEYAFYGGIYIFSSLGWMWLMEGNIPDKWDCLGVLICILGSIIILFSKR